MSCGVYLLTAPNGEIYVGSSQNIESRFVQHLRMIRDGQHTKAIQAACADSVPELKVLEVCGRRELAAREEFHIARLSPSLNAARVGRKPLEGDEPPKRIIAVMPLGLIERITDFQFENRIPSQSAAIRQLLEAGLAEVGL